MNRTLIASTLLSAALTLCVACCEAKADSPPNIEAGAYASSLPPIYPTPEQQQAGAMWKTTEILHCPDGYRLSFDSQPATTGAAAPTCVPMTAQQLNGGQQ